MFMFPLEGENPTRHIHFVLWTIIILCLAIFVVTLFFDKKEIFSLWGYVPATRDKVTIFTSMFLHISHWHIIGNMFFLWMFGDNIEDVVGQLYFLICYIFCGIAATLTYTFFHQDSIIPLVGASGAVSGIIGMYLMFFPKVSAEIVFYILYWEIYSFKTTIFAAVGCWVGIQILFGLLVEATSLGNYIRIAFSAHAGGFIMGVILGYLFVENGYIERYFNKGKKNWLLGYAF